MIRLYRFFASYTISRHVRSTFKDNYQNRNAQKTEQMRLNQSPILSTNDPLFKEILTLEGQKRNIVDDFKYLESYVGP